MILGITDTLKPNLQCYIDWIRRAVSDVEIIPLSYVLKNLEALNRCEGIVLTGGGDIHPKHYGREDASALVRNVDEYRDQFEFDVVKRSLENNLPMLGICRGMQMCNVALGGTMIPDVEGAGYKNHKKGEEESDPRHSLRIREGSLLHLVLQSTVGEVNTNHHQAVRELGRGLTGTAWSYDGLVEGLEWEQPKKRPFLQLVQWHPERMVDFSNPLSKGLLDCFIHEVQASTKLQVSTQS